MDRGEKDAKRLRPESAMSLVEGARSFGNGRTSAEDQISFLDGETSSAQSCIIHPRL